MNIDNINKELKSFNESLYDLEVISQEILSDLSSVGRRECLILNELDNGKFVVDSDMYSWFDLLSDDDETEAKLYLGKTKTDAFKKYAKITLEQTDIESYKAYVEDIEKGIQDENGEEFVKVLKSYLK